MTARRLAFELTNRCNLACRHCMRGTAQPRHDLPFALICRVLDQAQRLGVSLVSFTGGEPLLHPQFEDLIRATVERGYTFSFVTNGHLLSRVLPLLSEPAVKEKLVQVAVSLDGPDAETHDAVRGPGSFRKVMAAIAGCHARGLPTRLKPTVNRKNLGRLEEMALLAAHLGLTGLDFSHMHPTPDNLRDGLMLAPAEWRQVETAVARLAGELKIAVGLCAGVYDPSPFYLCANLSMIDLYVDVRGNLCLCCMLPAIRGADPDQPEPDVIANLAEVDLVEAHVRLVDRIAEFHRHRLRRLAAGELSELEHFQCLACARYFGKLEWLKDFPDSPWAGLVLPRKEPP